METYSPSQEPWKFEGRSVMHWWQPPYAAAAARLVLDRFSSISSSGSGVVHRTAARRINQSVVLRRRQRQSLAIYCVRRVWRKLIKIQCCLLCSLINKRGTPKGQYYTTIVRIICQNLMALIYTACLPFTLAYNLPIVFCWFALLVFHCFCTLLWRFLWTVCILYVVVNS